MYKRQILESLSGITFVSSVAEATDLIEFTRYAWEPDAKLGVVQTWQFYYRPLEQPYELAAARAKPSGFLFKVPGRTLAESTAASAEKLRDTMRHLLPRFEPVVPK